jgi:hypothetical protein
MERHPFRPGSFVMGVLSLLVALLFLVGGEGITDVDAGIAAALLLIVAGGLWLLKALSRLARRSAPG